MALMPMSLMIHRPERLLLGVRVFSFDSKIGMIIPPPSSFSYTTVPRPPLSLCLETQRDSSLALQQFALPSKVWGSGCVSPKKGPQQGGVAQWQWAPPSHQGQLPHTIPLLAGGNHDHLASSFEGLSSRGARQVQLPDLAQRQDKEPPYYAWGTTLFERDAAPTK